MSEADLPPVVSIIGRKNSGKTSLTVALAAELKRRGYRIASVKHGHHDFEIDQPGRDSWRHFHEGEVEAVLMVASGKLALVSRLDVEPEPERLVERFFAGGGYDLVLVEGFKRGPFPKVEVHRRALHDRPLFSEPEATLEAGRLALVADEPIQTDVPLILLEPDGRHVPALADLLERELLTRADP